MVVIVNSKEDFFKLLETEKVVLVDFFAEWCGPCKKIAPQFEKLAAASKVTAVKINADDNEEWCAELDVSSLPMVAVFKHSETKPVILQLMNPNNIEDVFKQAQALLKKETQKK